MRSKRFFAAQQASLGDLDGYIEEMVSGQKVIKVFNHEQANVAGFDARTQELRRTGTAAVSYANSMPRPTARTQASPTRSAAR